MRNRKKIIRACTVPLSLEFFEEIVVKMHEDGYEPVVVTSPGDLLDEFKAIHKDIKTIEVSMERHISLRNDIVSLWRMVKVFAKEKPYIVHSLTPKAGLICMIAAWICRVPKRVHTFTGLVWPTATGLKRKVLMLTDCITCACATHIIPEGQGVMADLQAHITKKPMKVLGYGSCKGVDMERFNPERLKSQELRTERNKQSDCFTFLFVGRIVSDKGINELVEAFCRLKDELQKVPEGFNGIQQIRLVFVGHYESELDPVSELTQKRIASCDAIETPGLKSGDDLIKEYMKADCFVMPSYREGFPNTVLEAGAMGLPQIVTDINGSREIISQSRGAKGEYYLDSAGSAPQRRNDLTLCANGIVIPSKNEDALYEAMKLMIEDGNLRESMRANARPMIAERYEKQYVQKLQLEFYKDLLGE